LSCALIDMARHTTRHTAHCTHIIPPCAASGPLPDLNAVPWTACTPALSYQRAGSAAAVYRDIDLVFSNCKAYNTADSEIGKAGRRMQSAFSRVVRSKLAVPQANMYDAPVGGSKAKR
jgi:hypothetical protein